jgi:hypothetical protein
VLERPGSARLRQRSQREGGTFTHDAARVFHVRADESAQIALGRRSHATERRERVGSDARVAIAREPRESLDIHRAAELAERPCGVRAYGRIPVGSKAPKSRCGARSAAQRFGKLTAIQNVRIARNDLGRQRDFDPSLEERLPRGAAFLGT